MSNFAEFAIQQRIYHSDGTVKCLECDGSGWIWDPASPRDSYEGNKMRNSLPCPSCNKSKIGPLSAWKEVWRGEKKKYAAWDKEENAIAKERKRILAKLTKKERSFMGYSE